MALRIKMSVLENRYGQDIKTSFHYDSESDNEDFTGVLNQIITTPTLNKQTSYEVADVVQEHNIRE